MDLKDLANKKKKDDNIDPDYKKAKMGVLQHIKDMASSSMGEGLKGLQKVSVAAPDKEGLAMGLDKAKDLLQHNDMGPEGHVPSAEQLIEDQIEHEAAEGDLTDEEIDQLIAELESKKSKKM